MKVQSKCKECGNWSNTSGNIEDRCEFCSELINKEQFNSKNKAITERLIDKQNSLLLIKDDDNLTFRVLKKIAQAVQIVFVAFASFILWLVSLLAG